MAVRFFGRRSQGIDPLALFEQAKPLVESRQFAEAVPLLEESIGLLTPAPDRKADLARSLEYLARALDALSERPRDRAEAALRAVSLLDRPRYPDRRSSLRRFQLLNLAANGFARCEDLRESARVRTEITESAQSLVRIAPDLRHEMAGQFTALAAARAGLGEFAEASAALATFARYRSDPEFTVAPAVARSMAGNLRTVAAKLNQRAWDLCALGEHVEALPLAERAIEVLGSVDEPDLDDRLIRSAAYDTFATALAMAGRSDEALDACGNALVLARELAAVDPSKYQGTVILIESLQARIEGREAGGFADRAADGCAEH